MTRLDSTLWRDMLAYLRQRHAPICRQWFEELEPLTLQSGLLRVQTGNTVQQNYLQRKCVAEFTEAAQAITNKLVAVQFVNREDGGGGAAPAPVPASSASSGAADGGSASSNGKTQAGGGQELVADPVMSSQAVDAERTAGPRPRVVQRPFFHAMDDDQDDDRDVDQILLSPDYSFSNFVTGPENQLAYAASVAVANEPGTSYNPLFIHGGVGLGKTHLLQAICQAVIERQPETRMCYLSCGTFVNDFLDCVQLNKMHDFRHRYREVDLLVIDDIQFLANRERTQEEFFHTFNELYQSKRQIVLSSDRPPADIQKLEERLVSRFQWGLVADVNRPAYETRVAIVRAKAKLRGLDMPNDVIAYIAERIESNARELEGAITSLQAHASTRQTDLSLELAMQVLGGAPDLHTSQVTLQHIIDAVTEHYSVRLSDLQGKRRQKSITEPRQLCMWLARKRTRFSLQEIGGYFGGRDHTTVMHSIKTVEERMEQDTSFGQMINRMEDRILAATNTAK